MAFTPAAAPEVVAALQGVLPELRVLVAALSTSSTTDVRAAAETIALVEEAGRLVDAARIRAVAPLARGTLAAEQLGFPSSIAAVSTIARVSQRTARMRLVVAHGITPDLAISGAPIPAAYPVVAAAIDEGEIGVDAAALITHELDSVVTRVPKETVAGVEQVMVNLASSHDPSGEREVPPVSVDYLATEIRQISATIDPDGAAPREQRAMRKRGFRIGAQDDDGLMPASGRLLPQVGILLQGLLEAHRRSPRFVDTSEALPDFDHRTPDQRRHDALAEVLTAAAASKDSPQLDGQPVTVLVTVPIEKLDDPDGREGDPIGTMAGSRFPVSRGQVERFIDGHGLREVYLNRKGRVVGISSPQRCFTPIQRMGIAARDGHRCSRPGCTSPHFALQVHHVIPDRDGGPTSIDNGILLCFWDHLRVDDGPWQYRMVDGMPEVRGPGLLEWTPTRPRVAHAA